MFQFVSPATALLAAVLAISIHGAGHCVAALFVGVRFQKIRQTPTGFRLLTDRNGFPSYHAEAVVALGGPLGNLLTALAAHFAFLHTPAIHSFASLFVPLSLYLGLLNLLPLRGFDGGSLLLCTLCGQKTLFPALLPHTAERILSFFSAAVLFFLWIFAVYLLLRRGSALSLYAFCIQLFRTIFVEHRAQA